ncbi:MAG: hypothetical protein A3D24_02855 [Candidatus Blackburnbacteria bacterium RIFCSPHIGHO2_02_FULL_39_13]|uniref:Uncharacterized protein n=1 Tax=Candidatus Blackburnbacteria bacterium RIFCSPLOWO2_01_FULL_40_20 TaxID=1797519 RepID=A0A1G1VC37_9BACT|nr:MAG: hypothetical protein A2694_01760 [Candidatus Blackburnbacteria bacterium RIFCSPHIGHO2_01_FULL_40_17]OGY07763.1 MAG: hypothetical protein A3D24_02855 [Candidatus Blackburnbacteria bacterium RIFCSPHIGHO2_02_FULL_39_13]OGY12822.1 MAG: hypothetical protein A3A77_03020 [Candidatus Blackburnbacteria bacterium RIFCSPLOWO2_01_FULL_40_20]
MRTEAETNKLTYEVRKVNALTIIRAVLVVVVSLILVPIVASTTLHPLFAVAIAFGVVVFLWDVLLPLVKLAAPVNVDLEYLISLAATAVIVGAIAVSAQVKAIVGEPTITTFATAYLVPGVVNWLVKLSQPGPAKATVAA